MKNILFQIFIYSFLFAIVSAFFLHMDAFAIPHKISYEECKGRNKTWNKNFVTPLAQFSLYSPIDSVEAKATCLECISNFVGPLDMPGLRKLQTTLADSNIIPPICFYASAINGAGNKRITGRIKHGLFGCKKNTDRWAYPERVSAFIKRTRPCLNQDYIDMTAASFNQVADCLSFSANEKKQAFALFNHESHFILNARSPTGARCYGQLTSDTMAFINKHIYRRNPRINRYNNPVPPSRFGYIYTNAVKKCPGLKDKVIPQDVLTRTPTMSDKSFYKMVKQASLTCGMTHDPYSCLFYSMFNIRINMKYFDNTYSEIPDYLGSKNPPKKMPKKAKERIRLNEIMILQGEIQKKGDGKKPRKVEWVMWDSSEVYNVYQNLKIKSKTITKQKIKTVPLFNPNLLRDAFVHMAHNGGHSVIRSHLQVFVENIKKKISNQRICKKDRYCKEYRSRLLDGKSLTADHLFREWRSYVDQTSMVNSSQLKKFTRKIQSDLDFLHNKNNLLKSNIKHASGKENPLIISKDKFPKFLEQVKASCPRTVY